MAPATAFQRARTQNLRDQAQEAAKVVKGQLKHNTYHDTGRDARGMEMLGRRRSEGPTSPLNRRSAPKFVDERVADVPRSRTETAASAWQGVQPEGWYRTGTEYGDDGFDGARNRAQSERARAQSERPRGESSVQQQPRRPGAKSDYMSAMRSGPVLVRNPSTGEFMPVYRDRSATAVSRAASAHSARSAPSPRARSASRDTKKRLGAHYEWVCADLFDNYEDEDRHQHDRMLADTLTKLRPTDEPHPLMKEPRVPMTSAFTDRAARIREGRGARGVLNNFDQQPPTEWGLHGDCCCPVCMPHQAKAAGAPSHLVWYHRLCPSAQDHIPVNPDGQVHDCLNSDLVATAILHKTENCVPTAEEERTLRRHFGPKIKGPGGSYRKTLEPGQETLMMPHRPYPKEVDDSLIAGQYNQEYRPEIGLGSNKGRQLFQGLRRSQSVPRSGVALCLSPRPEDPPAPTKITHTRRADGECRELSQVVENHVVYHNQETLRFANPQVTRGRNTVTPDYEAFAGMTSQVQANRAERPLGQSTNARRGEVLNSSSSMSVLLDRDLQETWHKMERAERIKSEKPFSDMCTTASSHLQTQRSLMSTVKSQCGHNGPKLDLSWVGAEA